MDSFYKLNKFSMNALYEILLQKAVGVVEISKYPEKYVTILDTEKLVENLKEINPQFASQLPDFSYLRSDKMFTFSYGGKYFCVISQSQTICIPSDCKDIKKQLGETNLDSIIIEVMINNFNKMYDDMLLEGNFDISSFIVK